MTVALQRNETEALCRSGSVPDDVSEAEDLGDSLLVDVAEDCLESVDVAVDVGDEGGFEHGMMILDGVGRGAS